MTNPSSATVATPAPVGWSVDNRGYIHGGFGTPVFEETKRKYNTARTRERNKIKKSSTYGLPAGKSFDEYRKTHDTKETS
jgi:hypothetical protein